MCVCVCVLWLAPCDTGGVVPRAGIDGRKGKTTGSSIGTPDLKMRALALVGNGAKHIWWFVSTFHVATQRQLLCYM
jgi:hypothetical protein